MLSVPSEKIPLIIAIRVAKAEKLVPQKKDGKKDKLNSKYRVVILGGKKSKSSELIFDAQGDPEWGYSCMLKRHKGSTEPVILVVEDSDGHQLGQVVIPIVKIGAKPYTFSPDQNPATSSNLICSELEPTKKTPIAHGFLIYWIWVEEYCQEQDTTSRSSFKSMTSLFSSKHGSSKSRLSIAAGSSGNISSGITLNKPENHKKSHNIFHSKPKKDKNKKSTPDTKKSPDSSDLDSYHEPGNPFERDVTHGIPIQTNKSDLRSDMYNNPFESGNGRSAPRQNLDLERLDIISGSSNGSIFENDSLSRTEIVPPYQSVVTDAISPVTLPPVDSNRFIPRSPIATTEEKKPMPTTLLGKSNLANQQTLNAASMEFNPKIDSQSSSPYQSGHKAPNDSINSLFAEQFVNQQPIQTSKGAEIKKDVTSFTPVTVPPYETESFKKPFPKTSETSKLSSLERSNESSNRSSELNRDTYQQEITPGSSFDGRDQPGNKSFSSNEYSPLGDKHKIQPSATSKKMPEIHSNLTSITPVTLPPVDGYISRSKSPANFKESFKTAQSPVLSRSYHSNSPSLVISRETSQPAIVAGLTRTQMDQRTQSVVNEDIDRLRKENEDLKTQNTVATRRISDMQNELDYVKDCLYKLRSRLLEEGATQFLEKF